MQLFSLEGCVPGTQHSALLSGAGFTEGGRLFSAWKDSHTGCSLLSNHPVPGGPFRMRRGTCAGWGLL